MTEFEFPSEVPLVGDLVRISPIKEDYVVRNYRFFSEEAHITSRFFAIDHAGRRYIEVEFGGRMIQIIRFNIEHGTWTVHFDGQDTQIELKKLLD